MDNSEEYVKMCRAAKEIQGSWNPNVGDFTFVEEPTMLPGKNGGIKYKPFLNTRIGIITDISNGRFAVPFFAWCNPKNNVWLPRQDQLQDMFEMQFLELERCFYNFIDSNYDNENEEYGSF